MLREEPAGELWRPGDLSRERREAAGEQPGECRLAVAVGADQRDAVVGIEPQVEPRQYRVAKDIADADPVERDQRGPQIWRVGIADPRRRLCSRKDDRLEPRQCLDPALRLPRLRGLGAKAVDTGLQPLPLGLLAPSPPLAHT